MSLHDGLVLLGIYVGVIGLGAVIDFVEFELKLKRKERKGN